MSLGIKSILLVAVVIVLSILAQFAIIARGYLPGFEAAEREVAAHSLRQGLTLLREEGDRLALRLTDWAEADATVGFLREPGADYPLADLVYESLLAGDYDFFAVIDIQDQLLWGAIPEGRGPEGAARAEAIDQLLQEGLDPAILKADRSTSAIVPLGDKTLYLAAEPVIDRDTGAAARGRVIMARLLTDRMIAQMAERLDTDLRVTVIPLSDREAARTRFPEEGLFREVPDQGPLEALQGILRNAAGVPVVLVEVPAPKSLLAAGRKALQDSLTAILIVGGTAFFLLLFGLQVLVLRPISGLARAVAGISL